MGAREIIFLLYTFVLPLVAIVMDDANWTRKERPAKAKTLRTEKPARDVTLGGMPHAQA